MHSADERSEWSLQILAGSATINADVGPTEGACTLAAHFLEFPPLQFEGKGKVRKRDRTATSVGEGGGWVGGMQVLVVTQVARM